VAGKERDHRDLRVRDVRKRFDREVLERDHAGKHEQDRA